MPPQGRKPLDDLRGSLDDLATEAPTPLNGRPGLDDLAEDTPAWKRYLAMGLRGGGGIVGAGLGGFLGSIIPGAGTAAGAMGGGALGGGLGEWAAEKLEGRKSSGLEIAAQAGLGAFGPAGKGASLLKVAAQGALAGGVGSAAESTARHGLSTETLGDIGRDTVAGTIIGGGIGAAAHTVLPFASRASKAAVKGLRGEAAEAPELAALGRPSKPGERVPEVRLSQSRSRGDLSDLVGDTPGAHGPETPAFGAITPREQVAGMTPERVVSRMPKQKPEVSSPRLRALESRADTSDLTAMGDEPFSPREPQPPLNLAPRTPGEGLSQAGARQPSLFRPPAQEVDDLIKGLGTTGEDLQIRGETPAATPHVETKDVTYRNTGHGAIEAVGPNGESLGVLNYTPGENGGVKLGAILVDPEHQRQGIGTGLLQALEAEHPNVPIDRGEAVSEAGQAFRAATGGQKEYVPAEVVALHQRLKPKWAQTAEETGVNMHEDLLGFNKRLFGEPNKRKLMGAERKAVAEARARNPNVAAPTDPPPISSPPAVQEGGFADKLKAILGDDSGVGKGPSGEAGFISPELAQRLGETGVGAAVGGVAGAAAGDDETRGRSMAGGALLGALAPTALRNLDAVSKLRYFGMLGSTGAQAKNVVGNAGSIVVKAAEKAMSGDAEGAGTLLKTVFHPETATAILDAFKHAPSADTRWGSNSGALGTFSRIMHAVDEGVTSRAVKGGLTEEEAKLALHTAEPRSETGQWLSSRPKAMSTLIPFARTATNILERGMEHTPGVGLLPSVRAMRPESTGREIASRQILGLLAALGGAELSSDDGRPSPYLAPALGPLALPYAAGSAMRAALSKRKGGDTGRRMGTAALETLRQALPLPTDAYGFDLGRFGASFVPGVLGDASLVDPRSLDQTQSLFDPAIAKIPILNESLLRRKSVRRSK